MENNHNDNQTKSTSALNQEEIQMYLKDIRKIKVMTPDRERELSEMMCSGNCTDAEKHQYTKNYSKVTFVLLSRWLNNTKIRVWNLET